MADIAEVLKKAKPPERTVELYLDADLAAQHDDLSRQLAEAQQAEAGATRKMGDVPLSRQLAERIQGLQEEMKASAVTFRMRGLSAYKRDEWESAHPPREGKDERFNLITGLAPLIAACCVDPQMTVEQAQELIENLGEGQTDQLFRAAWEATFGGGLVPFSVAASVTLRASEQKQK